MIVRSVEILITHVREHRRHFAFIADARSSSNVVLRHTIRNEIRLFASELATDLARFPVLREWTTADLQMLAGLFVDTMIAAIDAMLESPASALQVEARRARPRARSPLRPRSACASSRSGSPTGAAAPEPSSERIRSCDGAAADRALVVGLG